MFIGRDAEMAVLTGLLARVAEHRPATVVLDGEAGVGKTRLVAEFSAAARAAGAVVLAGGCLELAGGAIPYGPLIEALRRFAREHGEEEARRFAGPAWAELSGLIADFTGAPAAPALGAQTRVFGAVSRLLDHIGEQQPLVLVFEDVHWADTATLDLIAYLALTGTDQRLMLLCSYRSGLRLGHPLRARLAEPEFTRRTHRISLSPFTARELRAFVAALTGADVSPERADRYFALSEGNPYFTEQLVAAGTGVPESISDLMHGRLAQLGPDAARVVRVAAVAGRRVGDALLARVVGLDETALDAALTECLAHRVLVEDRVEESYSFQHALLRETAYEAVRPRERRRLHGALAEALAEEVRGNPHVLPELAYHWFAADRVPEALRAAIGAGDLAVRVRAFQEAEVQYRRALELWSRLPGGDRDERVRVLTAAADAARWAGHLRQAVAWAEEAVACAGAAEPGTAQAGPGTAQAGPGIAQAGPGIAQAGPGTAQAEPSAPQAVAGAAEAWPPAPGHHSPTGVRQFAGAALLGELYERLGSYRWEAGFDDDAVAAYRAARRLLEGAPPSAAGSRASAALSTVDIKCGDYTAALVLARAAEDEARAAGATAEVGRAKNSSGLALALLGKHAEGIADLREALRIATAADHLEDMLRAYGNLGVCLERAGRVAEAVEVFQQGLEKSRELGLLGARQAGLLANNACATLFLLGRWAEADVLITEVLRYYPARETTFQRLTKAEIDLATGRFDDAEQLLESVRTQPNAQPRFLSPLYRCLAELSAHRGDPRAALDTVRHGVKAIAAAEDHLLVLQLCAFGLRVAADAGTPAADLVEWARTAGRGADDAESAVLAAQSDAEHHRAAGRDTAAEWAAVARAWRELDRPYPLAYALSRLASAAARDGDRAGASAAAAEAAGIAERLGAAPLLDAVTRVARAHRLSRRAEPKDGLPFHLTARELEVLRELAGGLTNRQIGTRLSITKETVGTHLSNAYRKLGVDNKVSALAKARDAGLLR
ncbi:helix-turn-helix transcriptional regulator [Saccharothrix variisporea]|uniref:helix-turn-helix transcriptional regulator n=1 Tax=Saccharothrix variisporea TaxID=543527 RepID=UPI0011C396B5|nr:AAA family ATPase [Saccharothrix variisporea]